LVGLQNIIEPYHKENICSTCVTSTSWSHNHTTVQQSTAKYTSTNMAVSVMRDGQIICI